MSEPARPSVTPQSAPSWGDAPDRSVLDRALDAVTVRRVFGEAYELGDTTVIPVAHVRGGGGGGSGSGEQHGSTGSGSGLGFGVDAKPAGAFVVTGQTVVWQPAVDVARLAVPLGLAFFAAIAVVGWAVAARRS